MKRNKGFTIPEMLVVIAIILTILGLGVPAYNSWRNRSQIAKARATISILELALERYKSDNGVYPPDEGLNDPGDPKLETYLTGYMDFKDEDMDGGVLLDPWGNGYLVFVDNDGDGTPTEANFRHNLSSCYILSHGSDGPGGITDDDIDNYGPM